MLVYVPPWLTGWVMGRFISRRTRELPQFTPGNVAAMADYALLAGALGGLLFAAFAEVAQSIRRVGQGFSGSWIASALATVLLLKFYSLTVVGHIGLMGRYFSHDSREWWSRLGGLVLLVSLVWAALFSIVYLAPAERHLADLIYEYGEVPASRKIARAIVHAREAEPIRTTTRLAEIVRRAAPRSRRPGFHPATRTFQALRIRVNRELDGLGEAFERAAACLRPGGRLAVIAFHSLEDRAAKQAFRALATRGYRLLVKKPVRPGAAELGRNPRARSARLRAIAREEAA